MEQRLEPLFTPWKIGNCEIKNRIVLTSMGGTNLLGWMEVNHFDKDGARFIMEVAKNNCGLVLPGCQPVYNPMYGKWLYKNEKMYQDLAKWMPEFHKTGAKLFVQLTAGFGRSFTISSMMETLYTNKALRVLAKPVMDLDKITAAPSPSPNRWSDKGTVKRDDRGRNRGVYHGVWQDREAFKGCGSGWRRNPCST